MDVTEKELEAVHLGFRKTQDIFWPAGRVSTSQELGSMELISLTMCGGGVSDYDF